jgi:hypothetical protein
MLQSLFCKWTSNFICNIFAVILQNPSSRQYQEMKVCNSGRKISCAQVYSWQHETAGGRLHENIHSWNIVIIPSQFNFFGINPVVCSDIETRNFQLPRLIERIGLCYWFFNSRGMFSPYAPLYLDYAFQQPNFLDVFINSQSPIYVSLPVNMDC